jgi:hypothetical protein
LYRWAIADGPLFIDPTTRERYAGSHQIYRVWQTARKRAGDDSSGAKTVDKFGKENGEKNAAMHGKLLERAGLQQVPIPAERRRLCFSDSISS